MKTFWKKQIQTEATRKQKIFDGIFGIILPALCFLFDPIVFKGGEMGFHGAWLGAIKPFAYILTFVSIMSLLAFILWGKKLKWVNGFLSGLFSIAALFSFTLGILLLPFSLFGLLVLIGILGFTPFLTIFVFLRNAIRTYKTTKPLVETKLLFNLVVLGSVFSITLPIFINLKVETGLETMKNGDVQTIHATAQRFKYISPIVNFNKLAGNYCENENNENQKALAESYLQLEGKSIEKIDYAICNDF